MKSKLVFIAVLVSCIANAQSPNWLWAKSSVGIGDDEALGTICDVHGNVFVTGWFNSPVISFGTNNLTNADNSGSTEDIFLAKYDSLGNVLWAKSATGNNNDEATTVTTDTSGNTYVAGYFESTSIVFGSTSLTNASSGSDIFIAKYDALGNVVWAKRFGSSGDELAYSVCCDASGNIYMTGFFNGPSISFGSTTLISTGFIDMYLVKFDSLGNVIWAKKAGGSDSDDVGSSVCADTSGNILVTGFYYSSSMSFGSVTVFNTDNSGSSVDMFIVKYDSNGNAIWARSSSGGLNDEIPQSVVTDASGNSYVVGYFYSPVISFGSNALTNTDNSGATVDFFMVKYDPNGNAIWARSAGSGNGSDLPGSVALDLSGNIYTAGGYSSPSISFGSYLLNSTGGYAMFLVKYDSGGNVIWAKNTDGNAAEGASSVTVSHSGNVYVAGAFNSTSLLFGPSTITNSGFEDVFLAKLDDIPAAIENSEINFYQKTYPDPATEKLNVDYKLPPGISKSELVVFDLTGKIAIRQQLSTDGNTIQLNIADLSSGIYFWRIEGDGEILYSDKFSIVR